MSLPNYFTQWETCKKYVLTPTQKVGEERENV